MPSVDALNLIELGAVVLGLALLARVATRAGISPIPLYLLAGLAFGEGGVAPLVTSSGVAAKIMQDWGGHWEAPARWSCRSC
ncbi:MAG TPA: hypothetical protein VGB83_11100 [Actinomycetota bacterium]